MECQHTLQLRIMELQQMLTQDMTNIVLRCLRNRRAMNVGQHSLEIVS